MSCVFNRNTGHGRYCEPPSHAGAQLFADPRDLFLTQKADRLQTADIVRHLTTLEARPWSEQKGAPNHGQGHRGLLERFGVEAKVIRVGNRSEEHTSELQ